MKIIRFISSVSRKIIPPAPPPIDTSHHNVPMLPAPIQEQAQASSSTAPPLPSISGPKKRALLIGIQNKPPAKLVPNSKAAKSKGKIARKFSKLPQDEDMTLRGCHRDVRAMESVLIELYGYQKSDIVVLMDGDECILPTRENIMKHLHLLVADAQPGDSFFFHFSGHSKQEPTDDKDEEDGMDEFIVTYDNLFIKDDILRQMLVDPLPIGSHLITVFDTCHSASLLDLKHSRCNRVYVPWTNKGRRRSHTQWNSVVRRQAAPLSPRVSDGKRFRAIPRKVKRGSLSQVESPMLSTSGSGRKPERRARMTPGPSDGEPRSPVSPISLGSRDRAHLPALKTDGFWLETFAEGSPIQRCGSPEGLFCEGWCEPEPNPHLQFPDVISLSAAKDGQRAWEDSQGSSMTQSIVNILRTSFSPLSTGRNPHPTLHDLLLSVSHDLHRLYLGIHAKSRDYKKKAKVANLARMAKGLLIKATEAVEMDNFQNPQISSLYPLNTHSKRWSP